MSSPLFLVTGDQALSTELLSLLVIALITALTPLLVATAPPIIVAVTTLELRAGLMRPENAAALVGAGALSVLVFPLVASWLPRTSSS